MFRRTESYFVSQSSEMDSRSPLARLLTRIVRFLLKNWFMVTTILGVIVGFLVGFHLNQSKPSEQTKLWLGTLPSFLPLIHNLNVAMPGKIYIRLLQLTILPMIVANIITGKLQNVLDSGARNFIHPHFSCSSVQFESKWERKSLRYHVNVPNGLQHCVVADRSDICADY